MTRLNQILEIACNNALTSLDQNQVEDYQDNMRDTIAGLFPDWTQRECEMAEAEFSRIVGL